ncbi:uncharacterized protein Z518_02672 [Rhinocladiella mackenziei CBS 650.93]|uniref:Nucleoside phosphorylase domain-containing protein n=1 Tax=Rhinocladiella mackenziei CBS 650.93 TaxID=1442369 RepID=A0A0D2G0K7_9EURO|nr:uncharacterized protein Z518_02672 [Rhinocladiella mackenziei CBS 650.93]KIX08017.1 hypothetical protein Z518_02672 [Rhinocladiella mackenziei CBS 650.93]
MSMSKVIVRVTVKKPAGEDMNPVIHDGLIASGSQVMGDSVTHDRLEQELDVLCFEMEAARVLDNVSCLVVRGISDYANSRKNEAWQDYVAAMAAAHAKGLLGVTPSFRLKNSSTTEVR